METADTLLPAQTSNRPFLLEATDLQLQTPDFFQRDGLLVFQIF